MLLEQPMSQTPRMPLHTPGPHLSLSPLRPVPTAPHPGPHLSSVSPAMPPLSVTYAWLRNAGETVPHRAKVLLLERESRWVSASPFFSQTNVCTSHGSGSWAEPMEHPTPPRSSQQDSARMCILLLLSLPCFSPRTSCLTPAPHCLFFLAKPR